MAKLFDIELINNDLTATAGGDLAIKEATTQHQELLLLLTAGELKEFPFVGVGLISFLKDEEPGKIRQAITEQFTLDGMDVLEIIFDTLEDIRINAVYK